MSRPTVVLAGGGTGGHVFPLVAVAHALSRLRADLRVVFVGTSRGMETQFVPGQGFALELLDVLPLRGAGLSGVARGSIRAVRSVFESRSLLRRLSPRAVFSIGGYAAGPVSLAARAMGIPLALMEPNSVIGLSNRLLAPWVHRAYLAFEQPERHFSSKVIVRTGVPLRPGFEPSSIQLRPGQALRILVLGGSQGAQSLNETLPEALARVQAPISVRHQCGQNHIETVRNLYEQLFRRVGRAFAEVIPFIEDMPGALADADLVVGRSGASAVSEITAVGRPSILVPYPFASGDHQRINALSLEEKGAAVCIPSEHATQERMSRELTRLALDRPLLARMAEAARSMGRPHASETIALDFLTLAGLEPAEPVSQRVTLGTAGSVTGARHLPRPEVA